VNRLALLGSPLVVGIGLPSLLFSSIRLIIGRLVRVSVRGLGELEVEAL